MGQRTACAAPLRPAPPERFLGGYDRYPAAQSNRWSTGLDPKPPVDLQRSHLESGRWIANGRVQCNPRIAEYQGWNPAQSSTTKRARNSRTCWRGTAIAGPLQQDQRSCSTPARRWRRRKRELGRNASCKRGVSRSKIGSGGWFTTGRAAKPGTSARGNVTVQPLTALTALTA